MPRPPLPVSLPVFRFREAITTAKLSLHTNTHTHSHPHSSCFCCTQYTLTNVTEVRVVPETNRARLLVQVLVLVLVRVARVLGPKRACVAPHTCRQSGFHHEWITCNLRSDRNEARVRVVVFGFAC
jgi:hypothetical protein